MAIFSREGNVQSIVLEEIDTLPFKHAGRDFSGEEGALPLRQRRGVVLPFYEIYHAHCMQG